MAIKKPEQMDFSSKKFTMIISGQPGLGKTTLALSAPNPILFDLDRGISRVRAEHRCLASEAETYEETLEDMQSAEYKAAESVVIDTGGSLVQLMQPWAKKQDRKAERDGRAMFGVIKREFDRLTWQIRNDKKHCIIIFHTTEVQKGDIVTTRLSCEGSAKDIVWTPADLGGYMFMQGSRRMIGFTPTEEYFAKGCFGIKGLWEIPDLSSGAANTFLSDLFAKAHENLAREGVHYNQQRSTYDEIMKSGREVIEAINDVESATAAANMISIAEHALTSKDELRQLMANKIKQLGYTWDKAAKRYVENNA